MSYAKDRVKKLKAETKVKKKTEADELEEKAKAKLERSRVVKKAKEMTIKEKLNWLTKAGFSNTFISRGVNISPARVYNAGSQRKVNLSDSEEKRINDFYVNANKLVKDGSVK